MKLIPNWRKVICRAYSVHFGALSFVCMLLGVIGDFWPLFEGLLPIHPMTFAILGLTFGLFGLIGRFIPQSKISGNDNAGK
jgi:hypothetical protein